ncbi:hypothetical protein [Nocardioides alcanivorans]|uniref:hypothetical protein n=1 Tax=Nocardioides alcanivorans TaxID=2897352 RepID=UPI001F2EA4A5|nr:hypothetical protein [Nocardioides alcanivorans]
MKNRYWLLGMRFVAPPDDDERGDVPGWVLVTVMTAGLVGGLWEFADGRLSSMLGNALSKVGG